VAAASGFAATSAAKTGGIASVKSAPNAQRLKVFKMDVQSRLISASFTLGAAAGVTLGLALGVLFSAFLS
jgi:hypothetical protein